MIILMFSFSIFQNVNNRDNILNKRNKLNDITKGKYDSTRKLKNDSQFKKNNATKINQMNNNSNTLKNDTYESVCSPEDVAERAQSAQRHPMTLNGTSSSNNNNAALNNDRHLKRIVSAPPPPPPNESKGTIFGLYILYFSILVCEFSKFTIC